MKRKHNLGFEIGRGALIAAILLLAGWLTYQHFARLRLFALVVAGRSPVCPLSQALDAKANADDTIRIKDRILAKCRLRKEEDGLELWDTPKGQFWIPKGNRYVLPFNLAEMERQIYGSGEHFIHPGDVVLDCGASDGDFTREALKAGAKLVVSIEISPSSVECLRRNFAAEIGEQRVIVYPKGVWIKDDTLTLNVDDTNFAANSVVMQYGSLHAAVKVPVTTIDKIAAELKLPSVDFIKMDVEGAEVLALRGAHDTIQRFKPRLAIATEHKPDDEFTIPYTVRQLRPDYGMQCGPCLEGNAHIRPDVLFFF